MILATVGCSNYNFDRLFMILDGLCTEKIIDGSHLVAQTGNLDYKIENYRHFKFASNEEMNELEDEAEIIICHAGTGTVIGALEKGKKVIIFPRLQQYHEHLNDHQLDLYRSFTQAEYVMGATNRDELADCLLNADRFTPRKFVSNQVNFFSLIEKLIES